MEKDVPYIVYEGETARHERTVKRLLTALLITILLMVGTNLAWLYVWNQYDFSSETYTVESDESGNSNVLQADSMGRYSSEGNEAAYDVRMLLNRTHDEQTRQELSKLLDKLESM